MKNNNYKYSLWIFNHESPYIVYAEKIRDTNSSKDVDKWIKDGKPASFYHESDEVNADYIQFFPED